MKITNNNEPLKTLACGFEHSGTTLVSEILRQHPQLDSGFEGGFLLNDEAKDFLSTEPFCKNAKGGWGVSDEDMQYICTSDTWAEMYSKLREKSSVIKDKSVWLFDKTPRYMQNLTAILQRVPGIPCIVMVRDFRAVFWSSFKRTGLTIEEWHQKIFPTTCKHTKSYADGFQKAVDSGLRDRLLLIKYEELCLHRQKISKKIFDFLGLEFEPSYLSFENVRYSHVHGQQISKKYLTEYKDQLPESICNEIIEYMKDYKDWFWSE